MKYLILSILLVTLIASPFAVVSAQTPLSPGYLIVCGQENEEGEVNKCDFGDLITLIQRVINVIISLAVLITPVLVSYAGFLFITRGDDPQRVTRAKNVFRTTIIGFIIILAAWLIVSAILAGLQAETSFLEGVQPINL